jgi:Immunoglobulin-like domain of bacterial spore germination
MRPTSVLLLSILAATLLTGCLGFDRTVPSAEASAGAASGGSAGTSKSPSGGVPESTVGASHIEGDLTAMDDPSLHVPFVDKTRDSGGSGYDADTVLAVRFGDHGDYERAVVDLGTGKEPARTVPEWTLTSPEGEGILRVNLPSASATCVSDGKFVEGLLRSFHVVRAPDGGMFVDFFAREPFRYRLLEMQDPARLVVDFEPAGGNLNASPPAQGGDTVLVEPRPNSVISDPLIVSGYSRNPGAVNTITLTGLRGRVLVRRTVRSNDWNHTWGYFEATIDLPPFTGRGTLKVGTGNASDGTFEGIEVPVRADR